MFDDLVFPMVYVDAEFNRYQINGVYALTGALYNMKRIVRRHVFFEDDKYVARYHGYIHDYNTVEPLWFISNESSMYALVTVLESLVSLPERTKFKAFIEQVKPNILEEQYALQL